MVETIEGLQAVTVHISDVDRARKFYGEVLGFKEVAFNKEFSRLSYAIPGSPTFLNMHVMGPNEGGRPPGTVSGVVFTHHDPAALAADLRGRGVTITENPEKVQFANLTFVRTVFADPDGNEFIVRSPPS